MRVLVTGPLNPVGDACVRALADAGHEVRAFGVPPGTTPFGDLHAVACYPGDVATGGSVEPVAAECQAIVHAASLDAPTKDRQAHAVKVERGTRYTRFSAERELVERFLCILPQSPDPAYMAAVDAAEAHAKGTLKVPVTILRATARDPKATAKEVVRLLGHASTGTAHAVAAGH